MKQHLLRCWDTLLTPEIRWGDTVKVGFLLGCISNALLAGHLDRNHVYEYEVQVFEVAEASEPEPKEILIEVSYNWSVERTESEIRKMFPESPALAVAISKCESQFDRQPDLNIQSQHQLWYGQEQSFGLFQIHAPDWEQVADRLGLDFKNNPYDNLKMARYIYDNAGQTWRDWTCFNEGYYHKHL